MTLLPEIERQVVEAAARHFAAAPALAPTPAPAPARRARRVRLRRPRTRGGIAVALALAVAAPAVAATQPWVPLLGNPGVDGASPRVAAGTVPDEQRAALGVLRREQTEADRAVASRGLLSSLAPPTDGVRLADVRLLSSGDGPAIGLVPVERLYLGMPGEHAEVLAQDGLCLTTGDAVRCGTLTDLRAGRLSGVSGTFAYGLVPDDVARVRFELADGRSETAPVRDNFYGATLPAPVYRSDSPGSTYGLQRDPSVGVPHDPVPTTVTWLDAGGAPVARRG